MLSTGGPPKAIEGGGAMLERLWHGAVSSIASFNTPKSSPTSTTMTTTTTYIENNTTSKKSRTTTKPKVGRRFFQHDTRNNTDSYSYATGRHRTASTFTEFAKHQYANDSDLESEPRLQSVISIDPRLPTNRRNTAIMDHITTDIVNTKLRKKLFKIQRKLRLQTVALKQQQYASSSAVATGCGGAAAPSIGCCCSCACSAVVKTSTGESDAFHVHHTASHHRPVARQIVQQRIPTTLYDCSSMLCQGGEKGRIMMNAGGGGGRLPPIRVQGLRSVVR